ncbi:MAG: haloalkane dehalogenase [Pseudomonadales bacterium]|nr:haloalkane dehalogenase [Pseudomonadales bacterium]
MKTVRTPESQFENLEGYPFAPNYVVIDDGDGGRLRMHYVDEGDGEIVLCLHGQPTWSYLYRKMIPILVDAGYRVIAPDLVGFGKSDKPADRADITYATHVGWMTRFVEALDLDDITLVCQDWGGLIGLRVVADQPQRFARVVTANTGLPDARDIPDDMAGPMRELFDSIPVLPPREMAGKLQENEMGAGFMYWIKYCDAYEDFVISDVVSLSALGGTLTDEQKRAYDAPFPSEEYKQAARQFPSLVPIFPDDPAIPDNRQAWKQLKTFGKPFLTAFSDSDPVTRGAHNRFQKEVPGAKGQNHVTIKGAGHFLQEDDPEGLAGAVIDFIRANPVEVTRK